MYCIFIKGNLNIKTKDILQHLSNPNNYTYKFPTRKIQIIFYSMFVIESKLHTDYTLNENKSFAIMCL